MIYILRQVTYDDLDPTTVGQDLDHLDHLHPTTVAAVGQDQIMQILQRQVRIQIIQIMICATREAFQGDTYEQHSKRKYKDRH